MTLCHPTLLKAPEAAFYKPPGLEDRYPRLQILTIEELLLEKAPQYPRMLDATFKTVPKSRKSAEEQIPIALTESDDDKGRFKAIHFQPVPLRRDLPRFPPHLREVDSRHSLQILVKPHSEPFSR